MHSRRDPIPRILELLKTEAVYGRLWIVDEVKTRIFES